MKSRRRISRLAALAAAVTLVQCEDDGKPPLPYLTAEIVAGDGQTDTVGQVLGTPLVVRLTEPPATPAQFQLVSWSILSGGGSVDPTVSMSDAQGIARTAVTLGPLVGQQAVRATIPPATNSPLTFTFTALPGPPATVTPTSGDGQTTAAGGPLLLAALVRDQYGNPTPNVRVGWTVTGGGGSLSADTTVTNAGGTASVTFTLGTTPGPNSVTAGVAGIAAPTTFTATGARIPVLVASVPIAPNYGIHDTYVRDGIAFVFAWNSGVLIYDVGNGIRGGSPSTPQLVSSLVTNTNGLPCACVHNGWWFHNPITSERRYLFIGQEGPGSIGGSASGDIHVVDVSNLSSPVEVAFFHLDGGGTHNFWVDETAQVLYAAYYNKGVVALNVSGTLSGNLSTTRLMAQRTPGGVGNTFTWGVQLHNGSVYAIDMLSGLWELAPTSLNTLGGGNNVPERFSSDLWLHGSYAYTGTWGFRSQAGNTLKIWQLSGTGAPSLVNTIVTAGIGTVSDVEVSPDGKLLMFSAEGGPENGVHFYDLTNPAAPVFIAKYLVSTGVHTTTFATIGGRLYAFAAKDPSNPALLILDVTGLVP